MKSYCRKSKIYLFLLIILFLSFRLIVLFTSRDLYHKFPLEEYRMGTIAKEIMMGPILPIFEYQTPQEGGMLINGVLIIPFFILFGETGISLKLAWLFTALCSFILFYYFINKFFTFRMAAMVSFLFIFSPPFFTFFNLTDTATNNGNLFLSLLIMTIFYLIFFRTKKPIFFSILGLVCGFSIYFDYYSVPMILTCIIFWFIFDKRFYLKKEFFKFLVAFVIGISPWIYYNITHNFVAIGKGNLIEIGSIFRAPTKFYRLVVYTFPRSFSFKDLIFIKGAILSCAYYLIFGSSYLYLLYVNRKSLLKIIAGIVPLRRFRPRSEDINETIFVLVYPMVYIMIYCMTALRITGPFGGSRYLLPLYPFIFIIISLCIKEIGDNKDKSGKRIAKAVPAIIFSFAIVIGFIGNLTLISPKNWNIGRESIYAPYCDKWVARSMDSYFKHNPGLPKEKRTALLSKYEKRYKKQRKYKKSKYQGRLKDGRQVLPAQ